MKDYLLDRLLEANDALRLLLAKSPVLIIRRRVLVEREKTAFHFGVEVGELGPVSPEAGEPPPTPTLVRD